VLVMTVGAFAVGQWLGKGGLDYRSVAAAGIGSVLGLAIHPYTPMTLETFFTYIQVFRMGMEGVGQSGFELGNEIYPYPLPVLFNIYPLLLILVPLLTLFVLTRRKSLAPETLGVFLAALGWFAMTMASARFVEYSVLLLAIAVAFVVRDTLLSPEIALRLPTLDRQRRRSVAGAAIAILVGFHIYAMDFYLYYQSKAAPSRFFQGASRWMEQHLAEGETVINLFWDDFPDLFYAAPRQRYIWGLDPTYTVRYDPDKAIRLENFRRHRTRLDAHELAEMLQSRWLILRARRAGGFPELTRPPFREVYRDHAAVLYRIE
jgi:hypothetical protein